MKFRKFFKRRLLPFLQLLLTPVKLAAILIPLVAFMVFVNYRVDRSGLYQGDLVTRTIVDLLLAGENVSGMSQMDQRAVQELYIQLLPQDRVPETMAIGSSRVMQLTEEMVGGSFYNLGITGCDYRDVINTVYLLEKYEKMPKRIILGVDPWLLNPETLEPRSDPVLYEEALSVMLGIHSGYTPAEPGPAYRLCDTVVQQATGGASTLEQLNITEVTLPALFEPAYLQGNLLYAAEKSQQETVEIMGVDKNGDPVLYTAVPAAQLVHNQQEVKLPDGSIWYSEPFRTADEDAVLAEALNQAGTFWGVLGFMEMDNAQCRLFEQFIAHLQSQGVEVIFFLSPYHPFMLLHASMVGASEFPGFFQVEPYLRDLAARRNITVVGSYDFAALGLRESGFFDGLHVRADAIQTYFGGLDENGQVLPGTFWDGVALEPLASEDGETESETEGEAG